MIEKDYKLQ